MTSLKELIILTFDVYDVLKVYFGTTLPTEYIALHFQLGKMRLV